MKRALAGVALVATLALAGCSNPHETAAERQTEYSADYVTSREVALPDGSTVTCVIFAPRGGASITCDWGGRDGGLE
jgi:outer membrane protein assembly factor BamE (lipoprotein component of BamABCDE complex)